MPESRLSVALLVLLSVILPLPKAMAAYAPEPDDRAVVQAQISVSGEDEIVRSAAAAFFRGDSASLETLASRTAQSGGSSSLVLTLRELATSLNEDRQGRLQEAESLAQEAVPPGHVKLKDRMRQEDPLLQAAQVRRQQRWNMAVAPVNYLSRSVAALFQGNLRVLLSWTVDGLDRLRQGKSRNEWDRKLATLHEDFLQRNPQSPEAPRVKAALESLRRNDQRQEALELLALSDLQRKAGRPREALFYADAARRAGADAHQAELKASQAISQEYRDRDKALTVLQERSEESPELRRVLQSLAAGDSVAVAEAARDYDRLHPERPVEVDYLRSVALQAEGRFDEARALREHLANKADFHFLGRYAGALNNSADADARAAWETARAASAAEKRAFVLHGGLPARDELQAAQGGQGLRRRGSASKVLSAIFFPDAIVRGIKTAFGAGPSNDPVKEAAARWAKAEPQGSQRAQLQGWLAEQAEKEHDYEGAQANLQSSGQMGDAKQRQLREKKARDLFARIQQVQDLEERQQHLIQARPEFLGTEYEQRANEEISKLQGKLQLRINRRTLLAMPSLRQALNWPEAWFDGRLENREIAEDGVAFIPPDYHEAIAQFATVDGMLDRRRQVLEGESLARVQAILQEYRMTQSRSDAAEALSDRRYVPLNVEGGIGSEGISVYPTLREYQMPEDEAPLYR